MVVVGLVASVGAIGTLIPKLSHKVPLKLNGLAGHQLWR